MKPMKMLLAAMLILVVSLMLPSPSWAAFGVTDNGTYYTVDSGAGLVFDITHPYGDIERISYKGALLEDVGDYGASDLIFGIGAESVTATNINNQYVVITLQTSPTNTTVANLTHYIIVKNGENNIHMATYVTQAPSVGELRWITRLRTPMLPNGPAPTDLRGNTGAIESSDVFGMADGTTRSKYYGDNVTHGKDRAMDLTYCGATGNGIGVWMVYGNRESSAGGPFYRDIQNQYGSSQQEIYNYMFSGHAQWENWRFNVLYGPYTLVFNDGSAPSYPIDYSWIDRDGINLTGWVPASGRGTVSGTVSGVQDGFETVVGFANTNAQYWATATNGTYTTPLMKPGTYAVTLYQQEFEVATDTVTVTAGNNAVKNLSASAQPTIFWRLGERDGTPAGLLNADKVIEMHPKDVRMGDWGVATNSAAPYVIGGSTPCSEGVACYQWQGIGSQYVQFYLTPAQVVNSTIRIGITTSYAGGRPGIQINGLSTYETSYPNDLNSRSMTIGTWRGVNFQSSFSVSSGYLLAGWNTLKINVVSGSGWTAPFLSPGMGIDYIEMSGPASTVPPTPAGLVATAGDGKVDVAWNAVDWAEGYVLERAIAVGGPYTVLSSDLGPAHYTDTAVVNGTTYYYRVSAVNSAGTSAVSSAVSATPQLQPPAAPAGLSGTVVSSSRINLSWAATTGADSYNIKRSSVSGGPYTTIATGVTGISYSDTGLSGSTTYYYVVSAVNTAGEGSDSTESTATTWANGVVNIATDSGSGVSSSTNSNFNLSGGNAIVVLVSAEGASSTPSYSVTFGGYSLTSAVMNNQGNQGAAVFYMLNPPISSGDVVVTLDGASTYGVSVVSLSGAQSLGDVNSFASTAGSGSTTLSYNGTAGGIVLAAMVDNSYQNNSPSIAGSNINNYLLQLAGTSSESAGRADACGSISIDGTFSETFTWGDTSSSRNAGALAAFALAAGGTDTTPPAAPTGLSATAGNGTVSLNWADNTEPDLASYTVYRSTTSGSGYTAIASGLGTSAYTDNSVVNGTTYYYVVTATDTSSNESGNSAEVSATPQQNPPTTPTFVSASAASDTQIDLSWGGSTGADSYNVKRSGVSGGPYTTIASAVLTTSYSETGLLASTTYYYVISAVNAGGESADSVEVNATTLATPDTTPPSAPTGLAATAGDSSVSLDWADNTEPDLASYTVYRSTTSGSGYVAIASGLTVSAYTDNTVTNSTTYYYVVTATDTSSNESTASAEASATPAASTGIAVMNSAADSASSASLSTITGFNLNGGNTLVVLVSGEGPSTTPSYTVTFGGVPVTANVFNHQDYQGAAVFYVINPSVTSGDVVVTFDGATRYAVTAISLSNVVTLDDSASFASTAGSGFVSLPYNGSAGGLAVASLVDNDYQGGLPTITGGNINTYLQQISGTSSDSAGRAQAYGSIASNGTYSTTFTWGAASSSRNAGALVAFSSTPDTTPPAAPTGLAATAGDSSVALTWTANTEPDLASYTVYRSTTSGSGYAAIASGLATSSYTDNTAVNGTTYYYVVTATDTASNESANSAEVSATPQAVAQQTVHVDSIVASVTGGRNKNGVATVTILDASGQPVSGMTVTGDFTGSFSETDSAVTDGSGVAVVQTSSSTRHPSFTFTVTGVTGTGYTYDPASNVVSSATY